MRNLWNRTADIARTQLRRLARDVRGNAIMITGFAMIPMLAMIGSGFDMSRGYTAQTRLQQACDAGALAGRRKMEGDVFNTAVQTEAKKFFDFNFKQQTYDTATFTPTVTKPEQGVIRVQASTTMPTVLMKMFGYTSLPLSVDCTASQDYVNTDIVLVLDNTGSMAWKPNGGNCNSKCQEDGGSRIQGLQAAVMALYDQLASTQTQLEAAGMRLRYGIVPYSSTVNVGKLLYAQNTNYIRDPAKYLKRGACNGWDWWGNCNSYAYTPTDKSHDTTWLQNWAKNDGTRDSIGCIEERQTTAFASTTTTATLPAAAYDLDIDLLPTSSATRWPPMDVDAGDATKSTACPFPSRRLQSWTRANLQTYVNKLSPTGGTYLDIGMIWGAHLISAGGVFSDSPKTYKNLPVNKYVIFMTDGQMDPDLDTYTAYGVERFDKRVTSSGNNDDEQEARHKRRFTIACDKVKQMDVKIFTIAFGTSPDAEVDTCSTDGEAIVASDNDALTNVFKDIGRKIGALRLTK